MSVPLSRRTLSELEFYSNAVKMRICITNLLLRDFGIKDKKRNLHALIGVKCLDDEDVKALNRISEKYNKSYLLLEKYPEWLINYLRSSVLDLLRRLIQNIVAAYNIYVTYEGEFYERRKYQDLAIVVCEQLLQEFQFIIEVIPCRQEKFYPYVDMIDKEIEYLKIWQANDVKLLYKANK